ncbi:hypothetical protein GCM10007891_08670 [Methylophaga thalassica]|uniref:histidine kinase n=2 Tax=Methylophaga thalassica TaxID=40223 RepID=A0ABQ5TSR1_9GAMM|nr:hypothetical protein GCM10007891_08670 [Methylophaga thalassica]
MAGAQTMEAPKIPGDERERLDALFSLELLDSEPEAVFDNLTRLVADVFDIPIVAISLIDESRQWFKSIQGLDVCETGRDISFCGHAIYHKTPLVVENTDADERFRDNPLVTGPPHIVFYAGVPLRYRFNNHQYLLGTLCIIDHKVRTLSEQELKRLQMFAYQVESLIELRLSSQRLEQASKAKSAFMANMTHELRSPIAGVIGMLDILTHSELTATQQRHIELASKSADLLLNIINDILDFSKLEAKKVHIRDDIFNLTKLFEDVFETFSLRSTKTDKNYHLSLDWNKDLVVEGDATRLEQILRNLLSNADKFTQHGHIQVMASLVEQSDNDMTLSCQVIDSGIGINANQINRLFEPFEQIDNSSSKSFGGTGLGLVISKKLCELMGGNITVKSEPGKGSCFCFTIKLKRLKETAPTLTKTEVHQQASFTESELDGAHVLIVDDDITNRSVLEFFLTRLNVQFTSAENGVQASQLLTQLDAYNPVQLILMDCQMPVMDGYTTSKQIREGKLGKHCQDIPIIALTANAMKGDDEKCLRAGMTDYMTKPIKLDQLLEKMVYWSTRKHPH